MNRPNFVLEPANGLPWRRFMSLFGRLKQQFETRECLLLGGGEQPSTALNAWAIIGVGIRQRLELKGPVFYSQLPNGESRCVGLSQHTPDIATKLLFGELEAARKRCVSWQGSDDGQIASSLSGDLPLYGGLAGALGYGFHQWCDLGWQNNASEGQPEVGKPAHLGQPPPDWPDLLLFEFENWVFLNLETDSLAILSQDKAWEAEVRKIWDDSGVCDFTRDVSHVGIGDYHGDAFISTFQASLSAEDFERAVLRLKQAIQHGELYQANLSLRLSRDIQLQPLQLFEVLTGRNPSPFSGYLEWDGGCIVSNSPERLLRVTPGGEARTRPIAGTRGRGETEEAERKIAKTLLENEKELAEHRMLVDLARNDLGRVCQAGTVAVDDLLAIERYSHVTHLVSNVTGQLLPGLSPWQAICALFPGGTITGCPKIRCVELLKTVEPVPRGFYTGALGYMDARSPAMDWNILIRSVFLRTTAEDLTYNAAIHVGAGIVQDAVPQHEYRECFRKAAASLAALQSLSR